MKYKILGTNDTVELTNDNFKAKGGEGSIHLIGDTVYKVCDPGKMIPIEKMNELMVLDHSRIIKPERVLTYRNQPTGYTMRAVPHNPKPLAQVLTKAYRQRENVTPDHILKLVPQIADGIRFIHSHNGYLQVDGNEHNYMVTEKHDEIYFIDVNSFQTPHFPADAIMPSIRDWHVRRHLITNLYDWTKESDWYSFAIISFYMFTAIHPFMGRHPSFTNTKTLMTDQMKACKSVLDPETKYPLGAVYHPFENVIPGGKDGVFMQWYRAIFIDNKRLPAPKTYQSTLAFVVKVKEIIGSNNFDIAELRDYGEMITQFFGLRANEVIVTKNNLFVGGNKKPRPAERFRVGFTPKNHTPFACWLENEHVKLQNLQSDEPIDIICNGTDIMSCEGRVYVQSSNNIFEIDFIEHGKLVATNKNVATIMPAATQLFHGVAVQDMFGTLVFSIFPDYGHHRQVKIQELSGLRIIDAKYEGNVLMVLASNKQGSHSRFVFRFSNDWMSYDIRTIEDISPVGINFTVLERGICVCLTEEEKIEIFLNEKDSRMIKSIDDPAIDGEMRLCHNLNQAKFARGSKMFSLATKK